MAKQCNPVAITVDQKDNLLEQNITFNINFTVEKNPGVTQ